MKKIFRCQNCEFHTVDEAALKPLTEQGIFDRVMPGEPMPSGECPGCGAAVHAARELAEGELPPDPDGKNDDRAVWSEHAMRAFAKATRMNMDVEPDDVLSDLLADLMHWCDRSPVNFDRMLSRARSAYEDETSEAPEPTQV